MLTPTENFQYGDFRNSNQILAMRLKMHKIDCPKTLIENAIKNGLGVTPAQPTKPATVSRNKAALRQAEQNVELSGLL